MRLLMRAIGNLTSRWREIALALGSMAFALLLAEIGYRAWQYVTLPERLYAIVSANASSAENTYAFDPNTGYRYPPNFEGKRGAPWHSHWRTNSHGHVSKFEYPVEKPEGEFRIAVLGDSFTANTNNNVRWTEVLEEALNSEPAWRKHVGDKFTRVINFGVDGFGMVQFGLMTRHHAMRFSPDLIVVNFISDDLLRTLKFPYPSVAGQNREQVMHTYIQRRMLDPIKWFRVYPELLAATIGPKLGLGAGIPMDARTIAAREIATHYTDRREAVRASSAAMADILKLHPRVLFVQAPLYHEMTNEPNKEWIGLVEEVQKAIPAAKMVSLRNSMESLLVGKRDGAHPELKGLSLHQIIALPQDKWPEIYKWFFLPDDVHYSDYGTTLYAKQVAKLLIESRPF